MFVLTATILIGSLVNAKTVMHQAMLSRTQTAMIDATAAFVAAEQKFVQTNGTERSEIPMSRPITEPLCVGVAGSSSGAPEPACPYLATISWQVTGRTIGVSDSSGKGSMADARYLANSVDEQRISVTIAVQVSNASGSTIYGERSRELTARIFDAPPFVVVTGTHDVGSDPGGFRAAQGDTGGNLSSFTFGPLNAAPDTERPAAYTDTRIRTTIRCNNSKPPSGESPIGSAYYDPRFHSYGNHVWTYESSCTSGIYATIGAPRGYVPSASTSFTVDSVDASTMWQTGDENLTSFPR